MEANSSGSSLFQLAIKNPSEIDYVSFFEAISLLGLPGSIVISKENNGFL